MENQNKTRAALHNTSANIVNIIPATEGTLEVYWANSLRGGE